MHKKRLTITFNLQKVKKYVASFSLVLKNTSNDRQKVKHDYQNFNKLLNRYKKLPIIQVSCDLNSF